MLLAKNGKILLNGKPINLTGWRVDTRASGKSGPITAEEIAHYQANGLLGNAQGIEIWWSRDKDTPGEGKMAEPGIYNTEALANLLDTMRNFARAGCLLIPSIRVSYDQQAAKSAEVAGVSDWQGWAEHNKVINNAPVVVKSGRDKGSYGKYRDRFFAWLDWLIPQILADHEIAERIGYWEMWHYMGHKHNIPQGSMDTYLDDFVPRLIAKFREHEPERLLGVGMLFDSLVNHTIGRLEAGSWSPYPDRNLAYVVAGYGVLSAIMRPDNNPNNKKFIFPDDSKNPSWLGTEFNIEKFARLSRATLACQEGPGLRQNFRTTPIPEPARTWFDGLLSLYTRVANGWGIHAWPPSWADEREADDSHAKPKDFDETDFNGIVKKYITASGDAIDEPEAPELSEPQKPTPDIKAQMRRQIDRLNELIDQLP